MKLIIVLNAILLLSVSFSIQKKETIQAFQGSSANLGFSNQTGNGCSQAEFLSFINYINLASTYHRTDFNKSLEYISSELAKNYGTQTYSKYSTVLQSFDGYYTWYIYSSFSEYATTSSKVDRNSPTNSYMFVRVDDDNQDHDDVYLSTLRTGSGIDLSKEKVINNIILSFDVGSSCYCYSKEVSEKLYQYDNQLWSVVCSETYSHFFRIYPKSLQFIFTKPKNCYYTLWVH